jgi:hypothetical protein
MQRRSHVHCDDHRASVIDPLRIQHRPGVTGIGAEEWAADRCRPVDPDQQPAKVVILPLLAAERSLDDEWQAVSALGFNLVVPKALCLAAFVNDHLAEMLAPDNAERGGFDRP